MIVWQDNTRIEWEDIKTEYLPDNLNQTIEERCKNNDTLSLHSAATLLNHLYVSGKNNNMKLTTVMAEGFDAIMNNVKAENK